jgi:ubiquinone/menaquinone biosynthesis C-methylase UbiE/uncharacterized protein YbaR (Trm112 family)
MQASVLQNLFCPITKSNLTLKAASYFDCEKYAFNEIKNGYLESDLGYIYPIIDGVPRLLTNSFLTHNAFLDSLIPNYFALKNTIFLKYKTIIESFEKNNKDTQKSFSAEWSLYDYKADRTWDADREGMKTRFFKEIDEPIENKSLQTKVLLDAGCGNGLLDSILSTQFKEIVAIDFSNSILQAFNNCYSNNIHFVQADIQLMPFKPAMFDVVQCSGVLVCIKDQQLGFQQHTTMVKVAGKLSIWLYHPRANPIHLLINIIRNYTSKLNWRLQYFLYHFLLYPIGFIIKRLKGNKQNKGEMLIDIYDWFAPIYRWENTHEKASAWFESDFINNKITSLEVFGFNIIGIKNKIIGY